MASIMGNSVEGRAEQAKAADTVAHGKLMLDAAKFKFEKGQIALRDELASKRYEAESGREKERIKL